MVKKCVICGGEFNSHRQQKQSPAHPLAGRFETNSSAKSYTLVSPEGTKIDVTNLRQWVRENAGLFDVEPTDENVNRICSGFYTIAKNISSCKRGQTYKGWSIVVKDRRKNCQKRKQK